MKIFFRGVYCFVLILLIYSCSTDNNKTIKDTGAIYPGYKLIITTKRIDTGNKSFYTVNDSSFLDAANDSAAYLNAAIKYGRYITNWQTAQEKNIVEPIAFKIINEKNEDILLNLSPSQKINIDSTAKILLHKEKHLVNDSLLKQPLFNSSKKNLKNDAGSIIKLKPKTDSSRSLRTKPAISTYVPI